jgi:hypothetical protein
MTTPEAIRRGDLAEVLPLRWRWGMSGGSAKRTLWKGTMTKRPHGGRAGRQIERSRTKRGCAGQIKYTNPAAGKGQS